ncbi:hypothetical protein KW849_19860 [Pseudomonas sp. PDM26]|uniref:hypothetical protein n=1 Tax=Pseudomonas sp. PDM26 TaxID=2854766 RepID=UPI001C44FFBB|nr:hypothetical protein [Pseudomonas sp. PDM26]MBV7548539.1 hypothetical protein [Pseudomonas sp. PDM26]
MSIVLPSAEESEVFFAGVKLAQQDVSYLGTQTFAPLEGEGVKKQDVLVGKETPTIIGFADNLDEDKKQAAADSIHFSERYADANSDIKLAPIEWHQKYSTAMKHCGWTLINNKYENHVSKQVSVTMEAIVLDIIKAVAGRNASAMLELLRGVLGKVKDEEQLINLFDKNSNDGKSAEFRIVPCLQSAGGTAITAYLAVDCELRTQQGGAWFWKWKLSELKMKKVATMVELNMRVHERNRDHIYERLDKSSEEFFSGAKL